MTKAEKRAMRKKERREARVWAMKLGMSIEELADAEARGMNTQEGIPQYLFEIKEVKRAAEKVLRIDKAILKMSPEEQTARDHRLDAQKRAALNDEDLYLLSDDAYDEWTSGVLSGTC